MAAKKQSTTVVISLIIGMLLTGTLNTLMTKIQFTCKSVGLNGELETFSKPWFATLNMMGAMFVVGVVDKLVRMWGKGDEKETPLMVDHVGQSVREQETPYMKKVLLVSVPAAFDIVATALCAVGMLYIPASVWQMLRGSSIIFAAFFSVVFLKRKMFLFNLLGLGLCIVGVTTVGVANVLGDSGSGGGAEDMVTGMSLVIVGQVVQAAQIIAEEFLMKSVDLPPMQIIGWEGFWGTLMMIFIVYPILLVLPGDDNGHMEDPFDTFEMIKNSGTLFSVIAIFFFSCASFNATGIAVTAALSGVHRMMLDASRTLLIWGFGLFVHYSIDPTSPFGEQLTDYSGLQLVGFAILVTGQAVYGEVVKVPGLKYPENKHMPMPSPTASVRMSVPLPADA